jgi:hypothetical protein
LKRYEPKVSPSLVLTLVLLPILLSIIAFPSTKPSLRAAAGACSIYHVALLCFTVIYRISPFHPLAGYPGPLLAKISKFWLLYIVSTGKVQLYYRSLHEQYGDVVRVGELLFCVCGVPHLMIVQGPNELSIRDASVIQELMGADGLPKGPCEFSTQRHILPPTHEHLARLG